MDNISDKHHESKEEMKPTHTIYPGVSKYLVTKVHPTIYYIPDLITKEEEEYLMRQVYAAPKPRWTQLSKRRLQMWGGIPHEKGMMAEPLPKWLDTYAQKISDMGIFGGKVANHVLVNEYKSGEGIMPHEDGPLYYPTVSTISLGSHTLLDFYYHVNSDHVCQRQDTSSSADDKRGLPLEERHFASVLLEPRSLVLVLDDMYTLHLHGIADRSSDEITDSIVNLEQCKSSIGEKLDRSTRVSLTIRHVPKILKTKIFLRKR